jgi:hypothetical protein
MATPFFSRFSFAALATVLFVVLAASTIRAQTASVPTPGPDPPNRNRKRLRKKSGRTTISADRIAKRTIHRPPLSRP